MASQQGRPLISAIQMLLLLFTGAGLLGINVQAKEELETYSSIDSLICTPDVPGMVGYWPMDDGSGASTFVDMINPGVHDASCVQGKCPSSTIGKVWGAFNFHFFDDPETPRGDEVNVDGFDSLNWAATGSFSMETWVNLPTELTCESLETRKVFVGRRSGGVSIWLGCALGEKAVFSVRDSDYVQSRAISEMTINDGLWHHIVGVRNGTTGETLVYVDGVASAPDAVTFTGNFSSTTKLNFGWFNVAPYYWLTGSLDEIAVYNRALTAAEIAGHYADGEGESYCVEERVAHNYFPVIGNGGQP
jgi:hypothetical protein